MKYEVTFLHDYTEQAKVVIEADSPEAAAEQAEAWDVGDIEEWDGLHDEMCVDRIEEIKPDLAGPGRASK